MLIFAIDKNITKENLCIIKEILYSLGINYQDVMTIDQNLYHRYIELVSEQIENYGEISKIKSNIVVNGIVDMKPPITKITLKLIYDLVVQMNERLCKVEMELKYKSQELETIKDILKRNNLK